MSSKDSPRDETQYLQVRTVLLIPLLPYILCAAHPQELTERNLRLDMLLSQPRTLCIATVSLRYHKAVTFARHFLPALAEGRFSMFTPLETLD